MNSKIKFLLFLAFTTATFAQQRTDGSLIQFNIGDKYEPATIILADGSSQKGFINGFIENNTIDFGGYNNFDNFEGQLNLDDKKFYFKTELSGKATTLTQKDVSEITVFSNDGAETYRLLNIKTVGKNKEIIDLKRKAWLPLLKKDEFVNLYGFNMFINNRYVHTYIYVSNDNIDALKPTDKTFASMETTVASYRIMLRYIFKNCEAVNPLIEDFLKVDRWKTERKNTDVKIKEVNKNKSLTSAQRDAQILTLNQNYFTNFYAEIIDEYEKSCVK